MVIFKKDAYSCATFPDELAHSEPHQQKSKHISTLHGEHEEKGKKSAFQKFETNFSNIYGSGNTNIYLKIHVSICVFFDFSVCVFERKPVDMYRELSMALLLSKENKVLLHYFIYFLNICMVSLSVELFVHQLCWPTTLRKWLNTLNLTGLFRKVWKCSLSFYKEKKQVKELGELGFSIQLGMYNYEGILQPCGNSLFHFHHYFPPKFYFSEKCYFIRGCFLRFVASLEWWGKHQTFSSWSGGYYLQLYQKGHRWKEQSAGFPPSTSASGRARRLQFGTLWSPWASGANSYRLQGHLEIWC